MIVIKGLNSLYKMFSESVFSCNVWRSFTWSWIGEKLNWHVCFILYINCWKQYVFTFLNSLNYWLINYIWKQVLQSFFLFLTRHKEFISKFKRKPNESNRRILVLKVLCDVTRHVSVIINSPFACFSIIIERNSLSILNGIKVYKFHQVHTRKH